MNLIKEIKRLSAKFGIYIKPNTSTNDLKNILNEIDMVLIMTVEPGYGGQKLIPETLEKIAELRKMGFDKLIEVDGGITIDNATLVRNAGVDIIVAGTAVFSAQNKKDAINIIKGIM